MKLTIAAAGHSHIASLRDGRRRPDGAELEFVDPGPQVAAYRAMIREVAFDVCELAAATYMIARQRGAPFRALPIFLTRRFHPSNLMVRPDAGIATAKDLEGKRIGVRAYSITTAVWTRAFLQNALGVDLSRITWVVDDEEHVQGMALPPNIEHAAPGESLVSLMAEGRIDAAFGSAAGLGRTGKPGRGWESGADEDAYINLFPNALDLGANWYQQTGIYPFHGVIVVKDELLDANPWLAASLMNSFEAAKHDWLPDLRTRALTTKDDREYASLVPIVGPDPLPYGYRANRASIEAMMSSTVQQGLLPSGLSTTDYFSESGPCEETQSR
ncbi:MAG: hypothetical protein ABS76_07670 [Pelagibacterium sp. SCN 64-44]|nr:MAG: hypothetical protein ABS76_07670 [Pelagibacterium sp. SCN 64-44]